MRLKILGVLCVASLWIVEPGSGSGSSPLASPVDTNATLALYGSLAEKSSKSLKNLSENDYIILKASDVKAVLGESYDLDKAIEECAQHITKSYLNQMNHVMITPTKGNEIKDLSIKKSVFLCFSNNPVNEKELAKSILRGILDSNCDFTVVNEEREGHWEPVAYAKVPGMGADAIGKMIGTASLNVPFVAIYHNGLLENVGAAITDTIKIPMTIETGRGLVLNAYPVIKYSADFVCLREEDFNLKENPNSLLRHFCGYAANGTSDQAHFLHKLGEEADNVTQSFLLRAEKLNKALEPLVRQKVDVLVEKTKSDLGERVRQNLISLSGEFGRDSQSIQQEILTFLKDGALPKQMEFLKTWTDIVKARREEFDQQLKELDKASVLSEGYIQKAVRNAFQESEEFVRQFAQTVNDRKELIIKEIRAAFQRLNGRNKNIEKEKGCYFR